MTTPDDPAFSYDDSPDLYLFTSLTAGSSHIITATSRLETILKANRVPFKAVDCATDEKARRIWSRRSQGKKLPGLVREGSVLGDLEVIEEWNEYGEIKQHLGGPPLPTRQSRFTEPSQNTVGGGNTAAQPLPTKEQGDDSSGTAAQTLQNPQAGLLAAEAAKAAKARQSRAPAAGGKDIKALAESETDPTTLKNTEHNISPQLEKKEPALDTAAAAAIEKPKSPEAAAASLDSPPTSTGHAIIAHGAISAASERKSAELSPLDPAIKSANDKADEVEDSAKQQDEAAAIKAEDISPEVAAVEKDLAAGPALSSGEAAVHQPNAAATTGGAAEVSKSEDSKATEAAATAKTETAEKSEPKVSFAPDMTRELSEMGRSRKPIFDTESSAASTPALAATPAPVSTPAADSTAAAEPVADSTPAAEATTAADSTPAAEPTSTTETKVEDTTPASKEVPAAVIEDKLESKDADTKDDAEAEHKAKASATDGDEAAESVKD